MQDEPRHIKSMADLEYFVLPKGAKVVLPSYVNIQFDLGLLAEEVQSGKYRLLRIAFLGVLAAMLLVVTYFVGNVAASFGFSLAVCCCVSWFMYVHRNHVKFRGMLESYMMMWTYLKKNGYEIVDAEEGGSDAVSEIPIQEG